MQSDPDFKRAIDAIKLRAPIEDVVRERIPELKKSGNRWWACCPFHEENTPSFSVEPRLGLWYCFGACSTGGDQISFLQRLDNLSFMEVVEILGARTGVELPRRSRPTTSDGDGGFQALELADSFFQSRLRARDGRAALDYLRGRGLSENTIAAFGLGWAPADGRALIALARDGEVGSEHYLRTGLARRDDSGRPYSFFRGRLTIPIRDWKGRTVGFGARALEDGGPKYVNTPETDYFHKGRLIYALDRCLDTVRRDGRLVLVEGYTDVMAAHQAGFDYVVAVLGTSTTEDHAGLIRRAGARRVSLVFDGDEAGRKAAYKALTGLLPLDIEIDVVRLPAGKDPCDVLAETGGEGAERFRALLELAQGWFDFVVDGLAGLGGAELAREVDRVLELFGRVSKPVHRESLIDQLAQRLSLPVASVREQWRQLPRRLRGEVADAQAPTDRRVPEPETSREPGPDEPRIRRAYEGVLGAVLLDSSLVPLVRPVAGGCSDSDLAVALAAVFDLYEDEEASIDAGSVISALGDHPARESVARIMEYARTADDARSLLDGELAYLRERSLQEEKSQILARIPDLERASRAGNEDATQSLSELLSQLTALHQHGSTQHART